MCADPLDQPAGDDAAGWDRAVLGTMADAAAPDHAVRTVAGDDYLAELAGGQGDD
jgi:hypothetical protein